MTALQMHTDLSSMLSIRATAIIDCLCTVIIIRSCAQVGQTIKFNFSGEKLGGEPLFSYLG